MPKSKTAPVVLITGTSTGVGLHTAIAFAMAGYQTIATMRDTSKKDELLALAKANGVKVKVERLIDTGSLSVTTGRLSRPQATSCIHAPVALPKLATSQSRSRAASWPTVSMPKRLSFSSALGPMPFTLRQGSGQMSFSRSSS
eukprot:gene43527-57955_t